MPEGLSVDIVNQCNHSKTARPAKNAGRFFSNGARIEKI
jgi:hypothetical protein